MREGGGGRTAVTALRWDENDCFRHERKQVVDFVDENRDFQHRNTQKHFFVLPSQKVNLFIEFSIRQLHKKVSNFLALDRKIFCGNACIFR